MAKRAMTNLILVYLVSFALLIFSGQRIGLSRAFAQQTPEQIIDRSVSSVDIPSDSVSCPVSGGKITTNSYSANPTNGHCSSGYKFTCSCAVGKGRRANAIDVQNNGQDVILPTIGGKAVNWKLITSGYPVNDDEGGGVGYTFQADIGTDKWYLDMLHLGPSFMREGQVFPSGTAVAKIAGDHVHTTIGKNLSVTPIAGRQGDCDDGWLASEFICDPNKQPPTTQGLTATSSASSAGKSNKVCTKVGNPTGPNPCEQVGQPITGPGGPRPQAPEPPSDIRQGIINQFGISMNGFSDQYLRWAWEKLWEVSNTKFSSLVKGAIITVTSVSNSRQVGCPGSQSVLLGQFGNEGAFKHALVHELGHVIRNCAGRENAQETAFENARTAEGGVSIYGREAERCTGSDSISEDYAEMIAYYLNPGYQVTGFLGREGCTSPVINLQTQFPLHYKVAHDVLGDY